jgi:hypothetical protein
MTAKENQHGPFAEALRKGVLAGAEGESRRRAILDVLVDASADLSASTGRTIRIVTSHPGIDAPLKALLLVAEEQRKVNPVLLCFFSMGLREAAYILPASGDGTGASDPPGDRIAIPDADAMRAALLAVLADPTVAVRIVKYLEAK